MNIQNTSSLLTPNPVKPQSEARFGWYRHGHHAINQKAIKDLPSSSWKDFLKQNLSQLNSYCDFQDHFHPGKHHTITLDPKTLVFTETPVYGGGKAPTESDWQLAKENYRPEVYKAFIEVIQNKEPQVKPGQHALSAAQRLCESIIRIISTGNNDFEDNKTGGKMPADKQRLIQHHLLERIGALTHLIGDMMTPMHTATPHNWPLGRDSKWGIHSFLEGAFFNKPSDYELENARFPVDNHRPFKSLKEIEKYLMKYVNRSAEQVFRIVAKHKKVQETLPESTSTVAYEESLIKELKPIMQQQARASAKTLSRVLHSLWLLGGKPDMKIFEHANATPDRPESYSTIPLL